MNLPTSSELAAARDVVKDVLSRTSGPLEALTVLHLATCTILQHAREQLPTAAYASLRTEWRRLVCSLDTAQYYLFVLGANRRRERES